MNFENFDKIWLLAIIPLYLLLISLSYSFYFKKLKQLFNPKQFQILVSGKSIFKTYFKKSILSLAFITLIIAIMGPKWGYKEDRVTQIGSDIVILVDVSSSMLVEDIKPNRLEKVKIKINQLIDMQNGNQIALVVFAGSAFIYLPLTSDYNSLKTFVNEISPKIISSQGTDLTLGLETAIEAFGENDNQKILLVFTDGENHKNNFKNIIKTLNAEKIIVIAIGVGTPSGNPIPIRNQNGEIIDYLKDNNNVVISRLDYKTLTTISKQTGGIYIPSTVDKNDILSINETIDQSKKTKQEIISQNHKKNRYQIFAFIAFLILFIEVLINNKKE